MDGWPQRRFDRARVPAGATDGERQARAEQGKRGCATARSHPPHRIERLIRRRKETPEFGWGTSSLIETAAPAIFAHRCDWQGSTVAAVHNLSGSRTDATLDLGSEKGEKIEIEDLLEKRDHKPRRTEASTWSSRATATCGCAWSVRPETAERSARRAGGGSRFRLEGARLDSGDGLAENRWQAREEDVVAWQARGPLRTARATCPARARCRSISARIATAATPSSLRGRVGRRRRGRRDGLTVAAMVDTPKVMSEGNWRLGVLIDDQASDEQADKLGAVFGGRLGGPIEALGPLVGEPLGVERVPMELAHENGTHRIRVGDDGEVEVQELVPFGKANGEPARLVGVFHPAGEDLTIARATRSHVTAFGIDFAFEAPASPARSPGPPDLGGSRTQPLLAAARLERAQLVLLGALLALAVVAWLVTNDRMGGMESSPGMDLGSLGFYVTVWVVMMAAMMFSSVAPTVLMYDRLREGHRAGEGAAADATALFVTGYLIVWTAAGLAAYGLFELVRAIDPPFLAWDEAAICDRSCDRDRGGLPDDAAEAGVPRQVPQPDDVSPSAGATVAAVP